MRTSVADQLGNIIELLNKPKRIVSIVPSQTELLFDLGLKDEVVGITKFCIHPNEWFINKPRVGGTKTVKIEAVKRLQPDLILANKEENVREQIEELKKIAPVWISDIKNLADANQMIQSIGQLTGHEQKAKQIAEKIATGFQQLEYASPGLRIAYLIWREPYMAAAGDTFINDMLTRSGFVNVFSNRIRYPETTVNELLHLKCQLLLLSSEPYPFKQKHVDELQDKLPNTTILLVDGEMFSWYGSRLIHSVPYFIKLIAQTRKA